MSRRAPAASDRLRGWRHRIRALLRQRSAERELHDELEFHIEMETAQHIRAGMDPAAARRTARLAFGGVDRFAEDVRDMRNIGWLEDLRQDIRHAARGFRRSPGFTAAAIAALSLGIGVTTAVFPVVYAIVIAPLPYAEPERLVRIWETNPAQGIERGDVSPGTFVELRARSRTIERIALYGERAFLLSTGDDSWESRAASVSPEMFGMLGARPVLGRTFAGSGSGDPAVGEMVIGYELWQGRFGGRRDIIGRTVRMDSRWSYVIVGVMPPGFSYPSGAEVWSALNYSGAVSAVERQFRYFGAIARLREGSTIGQSSLEATGIAAQLESEFPASNAGWGVRLEPLDRSIVGDTRPVLLVLLGLAGCVLLIACANVATLAVARATARQHETAVRIALGAGRRRLLRQWTAEGLLLALLGGVGGLLVGWWSNRLLLAIAPGDTPRLDEVAFGMPVLVLALVLTCATAIAIGLAPAGRMRGDRMSEAMRTRSDGGGAADAPGRAWLLGAQVALTFVLTVSAVLLLRSFERLHATDLGFRQHDVLSAQIQVPLGRFPGRRPWFERSQFYRELIADLEQLPGVRSVAGTTTVPLTGELGSGSMWRTDAPGAYGRTPPTSAADQWKAAIQIVTPRYFETMGTPMLRGRAFSATDRFTQRELIDPDTPRPVGVAIINEAMAKRFFPDGDPLGSTIFLFDDQTFAAYRTIVGVVRDIRAESVGAATLPAVFLPFAQNPGRGLSLVLRSEIPPVELIGPVTDRLRAFDPAVVVSSVRPLDAVVGGALSRPRFTMLLVGGFAMLALVIAGVGIFGIVGYLVTRRTREIGIRMALGAGVSRVLWLVLRDALRPVLLGIAAGGVTALLVARSMQALLYGIAPMDAVSYAAAGALLLLATALASVVPARRAAGVDPLRSLRSE